MASSACLPQRHDFSASVTFPRFFWRTLCLSTGKQGRAKELLHSELAGFYAHVMTWYLNPFLVFPIETRMIPL